MFVVAWIKQIFDSLLPMDEQCVLCDDFAILKKYSLCERCCGKLEVVPFNLTTEETYFESLMACYFYNNMAKSFILKHKDGHNRYLSLILGQILADKVDSVEIEIDVVTAIPSTRSAYLKRGVNHAADIAKAAARLLSVPYQESLVRIDSENKAQKSLTRQQRFKYAMSALASIHTFEKNQRVLVVDDVLTTGATLRGASLALKQGSPNCKFYGIAVFYTPFVKKI